MAQNELEYLNNMDEADFANVFVYNDNHDEAVIISDFDASLKMPGFNHTIGEHQQYLTNVKQLMAHYKEYYINRYYYAPSKEFLRSIAQKELACSVNIASVD